MTYLTYLFRPEDTTPGVKEGTSPAHSCLVRTAKAVIWLGLAVLISLTMGQLG